MNRHISSACVKYLALVRQAENFIRNCFPRICPELAALCRKKKKTSSIFPEKYQDINVLFLIIAFQFCVNEHHPSCIYFASCHQHIRWNSARHFQLHQSSSGVQKKIIRWFFPLKAENRARHPASYRPINQTLVAQEHSVTAD